MARRRTGRAVHGWAVVDKPEGPTSTHVVSALRRAFDARKAGHAGTLDPLGSGVLPVAFGEATKTVAHLVEATKEYRFTIRWGEARATDDREGAVVATSARRPERADIERALTGFHGEIAQVPPAYSAIKIGGARAYDLAREGARVDLKPRAVRVERLVLVAMPSGDEAVFEMTCGKGTYVRALARDLAERLGTVGHVAALRRLRVGPFTEPQAVPFDKLVASGGLLGNSPPALHPEVPYLLPLQTALDDIPALAVSSNDAVRLRQGQAVLSRGRDAPPVKGTVCAMLRGEPVALCEVRAGELQPTRVFNFA